MEDPLEALPDYLAPNLDLVFVGINPSLYSARVGHYFAHPRNRFWRAFNESGLVPEPLSPETDHRFLEFNMGFTDLVKRPTRGIGELTSDDFRHGALVLQEKLQHHQPLLVCFQGITAYTHYLRYAEGTQQRVSPGLQSRAIGRSRVFVVPNPSPANAAFSLDTLVGWYRKLKEFRDGISATSRIGAALCRGGAAGRGPGSPGRSVSGSARSRDPRPQNHQP